MATAIRPERKTVVYFVESLQNGLIKIGYSGNMPVRMKTLGSNERHVALLATTPGGVRREAEIHATFHSLRIRGEWFLPSPLLLEYIAANTERSGAYTKPDPGLAKEDTFLANGCNYYRISFAAGLFDESYATLARLITHEKIKFFSIGNTKILDAEGLDKLGRAVAVYRASAHRP